MTNLDKYKIPVIPHINGPSSALEPNFNGNGRGPNGSYFTMQFNDLITALSFEAPIITDFTTSNNAGYYEVGTRMLDIPGSMSLQYEASNVGNIEFMDLYFNGVKANTSSFLPGASYIQTISDVSTAPNMYTDLHTNTWMLLGEDTLGDPIGPYNYEIGWRFRTIVGFSTSPYITSFDSNDFDIDLSQSILGRPTTINKEVTDTPRYLYIFLPLGKNLTNNGYVPYSEFKINGFPAPFELELSFITRFGVSVRYDVYRLANSTSGSFTVNLS